MIKHGKILLMLLFAATISAKGQKLIYFNSFNADQYVWKNYDDALTHTAIAGGQFIMTHKQHTSSIAAYPIPFDNTQDYAIETTVTHKSGDTSPVGLTFSGADGVNLYYFAISNGQFTVAGFDKMANKIILGWTVSSAILPGTGANKLRVQKSGNQFKYFINDIEVAHTAILPKYGDAFGFFVSGQQTAAFDYIKLTNISPATVTGATQGKQAIPAILETAYHTDFNTDDQNQWILAAGDSASTAMTGGYFNINRTGKLGMTASVTAESTAIDINRDYLVETVAKHYSGTPGHGYGLEFASDKNKQYFFWMSLSGYYLLGYIYENKFTALVPWTEADAINKTEFTDNKISISHQKGILSFFINDQLITTYPATNLTGHQFGVSATADQSVGFDYLTIGYLDGAPQKKNTALADTAGPEIFVTSPQVTRGLKIVQNSDVLHVVGSTKDASGIFSVVVNGIQATVDANGGFTADIPMALGDNPLMVVATDNNMNKSNYRFRILRNDISGNKESSIVKEASEGKFYALLIGVQDYKDQNIHSLDGPVGDAGSLLKALTEGYTFSSENVTLLKSPTRAQFFEALDDISAKIKEEDNLVVFYAGHGYYDADKHQGYWLPSDAILNRRDTWITNSDLMDYFTSMKAKHTLLISDACFSGSIFKTRGIDVAPKDIQELYKLKSRDAMTSGNMTEVPDNSKFMFYLLKRLSENTDKFLPAEQLFSSLIAAVINNNETIPQFGKMRESGDEGGDFIFIRKN